MMNKKECQRERDREKDTDREKERRKTKHADIVKGDTLHSLIMCLFERKMYSGQFHEVTKRAKKCLVPTIRFNELRFFLRTETHFCT